MALEDILKKIKEDAEKEAGSIKKEALQEKGRILVEANKTASSQRQSILDKASQTAELEAQRIITTASLDGRKELLSTKQEIINMCFNKTLNELSTMDSESYYELLKQIILNHIDRNGTVHTLILSQNDKKRIDSERLVDDVNQTLKKIGVKTQIQLSPEYGSFSGGFLLKSSPNTIKNLSWDIIFRLKRPEWELELSRILF